jgi:hypothetical protein
MRKLNKKGDIWPWLIAVIIAIAVLGLCLYLYFYLSKRGISAGDFITNILRFGK